MNLPTKLTVLRLVLSLVMIILLCFPMKLLGLDFGHMTWGGVEISLQYVIAGIIFIIASLTDFLDGYLARKNNQVTDTGKMLDAIADKVLVNSALIILAPTYIPTIVPVVIVLRDIVVNAIKMEAAGKGKVVAAIGSGKLKTATLMVGTTLAFFSNFPFAMWNIRVDHALLYVACILSIVSAVQYFIMNKDLMSSKPKKN